jgi:phosphoesterase RecJ-like protein
MLGKYKDSFLTFFQTYENFIILGHKEPDADCISSQVVLARFLEKKGKKTCLLNEGPFNRPEIASMESFFQDKAPENWLKGAEREKTAVCVVDCSTLDRVGKTGEALASLPICMLDHHSAGEKFGQVEIVDARVPSTTLIIQTVGEWLGVEMTREEAQWLFLGFATDTGFFRYLGEGSAPWVAQVSRLLEYGVSPRDLYAQIVYNKNFSFLGFVSLMLSRTKSYVNHQILTTYEVKEERQAGYASGDSDFIYQMLMMVESVEVLVFMKENQKENKITVSLRSKKTVDVGDFALRYYEGGGHKYAAGFAVVGQTIEALEGEIVERLKKEIPS